MRAIRCRRRSPDRWPLSAAPAYCARVRPESSYRRTRERFQTTPSGAGRSAARHASRGLRMGEQPEGLHGDVTTIASIRASTRAARAAGHTRSSTDSDTPSMAGGPAGACRKRRSYPGSASCCARSRCCRPRRPHSRRFRPGRQPPGHLWRPGQSPVHTGVTRPEGRSGGSERAAGPDRSGRCLRPRRRTGPRRSPRQQATVRGPCPPPRRLRRRWS
jgi:hypothetical protein